MMEFNERTEFFIKDTMDNTISEIQLRINRYVTDQELTKLDQDLIQREIMARLAYAAVKA